MESVLATLDKMDRWGDAMEFLTTNDSGDPLVMELSGLDREEAAQELLQALVDRQLSGAA